MQLRAGAALLVFLTCTAAVAAPRHHPAPPPAESGGLFQGTAEEQAACSPDATRFCSDDFPDSLRVLTCLQQHRQRLHKACLRVLESHGQ